MATSPVMIQGADDSRRAAPIRLLFFLAGKGLREHRGITALLVLAVIFAVAFQIPNTANLQGYNAELVSQAVQAGEVRVLPRKGYRFAVESELRQRIEGKDVVAAVPALVLAGAVGRHGAFRNAAVIGVELGGHRQPYRIVQGVGLAPGDRAGVLVGFNAAKRLHIAPGDSVEVRVVFGGGEFLSEDEAVGRFTLTTRGIAAGTFSAPDAVFVDRALLTDELGEPTTASVVAVYTTDDRAVGPVVERLSKSLPDLEVRTWKEDSTFASSAIESSAVLATLSRTMVALAVIVPVWALLYIHVLHRQRDIATLVAIGLAPAELFFIYLCQAILVGVAGVFIGGIFGLGLIRWFESHPIFRMDIFVVRPVVTTGTFVWPMLLVLGATLLASVIPAWRAARTDPAAILRERAT